MRDPFAELPELRELIAAPETSFYRGIGVDWIARMAEEHDLPRGWWHSDAVRTGLLEEALACHEGGDLWVFAYGSLMWDPAICFDLVRRAVLPDHARRFILREENGGRGMPGQPGLMAALDRVAGARCDGLVFRVPESCMAEEADVLFRRELIGPAYLARFVTVETPAGPERALTFVADYSAPQIVPDLSHAAQVACITSGKGILGTSLEYLENVAARLAAFGIEDAGVTALLRDARAGVLGGVAPE